MTTYKNLLYEKQRCGVLVTLNRPERQNALSTELLNELDAALAEACDSDRASCAAAILQAVTDALP